MKVAVSYLKSKYSLSETIEKINQTNAEYIHVDVMDGEFVENKTYEYEELENVLKDSKKELVEAQLKEIVEYLTDTANKCIWGTLSDFEKKKFIDLAYKNTRVWKERREKFINTISNYVTIDEAKQGLIKTKTIDRFIIK